MNLAQPTSHPLIQIRGMQRLWCALDDSELARLQRSPAERATQKSLPACTEGWALLKVGVLSILAALVAVVPSPLSAQNAPPDFTAIVRQQLPAVVAIMTRQMAEEQALAAPDDLPFGDLFRRFYGDP